MSIEKDDVINALKVLKTMLKAAKLNSHDVAELMIKQLDFVDFVPATPIKEKLNQAVKFNKTFEALYAVSMSMADQCIVNKPLKKRFEKLDEEYHEVNQAYEAMTEAEHCTREYIFDLENELSDLLFVLLHIGHTLSGLTAFEMLHRASSKMLSRMNDADYIAKN